LINGDALFALFNIELDKPLYSVHPRRKQQMTNTQSSQIDADREAYRKYYDSGVSALLSEIFGGNIHMGLFAEPDEPFLQAQERLKDHMAISAGLKPSQSVFEAACGVGTTALHLARVYGVHVHATNIAEAQLAEARDRARQAGLTDQVTFAFADYHDLGGPSGVYDCWWCQEALLYASDRAKVFSEARRVVKPGGRIVFTDLTLSHALSSSERVAFMTDIRAPHLWALEDYDEFIAKTGLRVIERQDWSPHAAWTFAAVARNLQTVRDAFASQIGEEAVSTTEIRIARQLEMARAGHLGWCFYALET
jgi:sarcosine/dimethylglycine N-methyltransferase